MLIGELFVADDAANGIAARFGLHRTTVQRWLDKCALPKAVYELLLLEQRGNLEALHPSWEGWRLDTRTGNLLPPAGNAFKPGHLMACQYIYHLASELQHQCDELSTEVDALCAKLCKATGNRNCTRCNTSNVVPISAAVAATHYGRW